MSRRFSALFVRKLVRVGGMESFGRHIGSVKMKDTKLGLGKNVGARVLRGG